MSVATEKEIFARNLRKIVAGSYMNQAQIAEKLGVSRGTMNDYLHGRAYPRPQKLAALCEILGVSQYDLTTDKYAANGVSYPNKEVASLAQNIFENPEKRSLYLAIQKLNEDEIKSIKAIVMSLIDGR